MISFACKNVQLQDIVMCSFELNKTEYALLLFMLKNEDQLTIQEIATKTSFERSTVQKAIAKLLSKELVERRQFNLSSGGYHFVYEIADKDVIKERISKIVEGWYKNVIAAVNEW
jgi:predicted transcriptional regulator